MYTSSLGVKAKFKESSFWACLIYTYITTAIFVGIGSICIHAGNQILPVTLTSSAINSQVVADWQTVPFVDIKIIATGAGCGSGYSSIFSRTWYGMTAACDCKNSCDAQSDLKTCYTFNLNTECSDT